MRQIDFIVIDLPSTYNGFLGRPFEHEFGASTSAHYNCIKFRNPRGAVGTIKGNQTMSRKCRLQSEVGANSSYLSCKMDHVLVLSQDRPDDQTILQENEPNKKMSTDCVIEKDHMEMFISS